MIVTIDGPSASGKGTLAKQLAAHFGYAHLDTGKIYRAVGMAVLWAGQMRFDLGELRGEGALHRVPARDVRQHEDAPRLAQALRGRG